MSGVCSPSEANYCSNPFEVFTSFLKIDSIFCHKCFWELEFHTKLTFGFFTGGSCGKSSTFTYYHFRSIFHLCNSKLKLLLNNDKYIHYNLADVFILFICIINFLIASQNISFKFESCFQHRSYMVRKANNRKIIQLIFRNKKFMFDEISLRNASKFTMF